MMKLFVSDYKIAYWHCKDRPLNDTNKESDLWHECINKVLFDNINEAKENNKDALIVDFLTTRQRNELKRKGFQLLDRHICGIGECVFIIW